MFESAAAAAPSAAMHDRRCDIQGKRGLRRDPDIPAQAIAEIIGQLASVALHAVAVVLCAAD